jgi:sigma-B regulation protein RsbU (phosphoserine phosphatase)
MTNRLRSFWDRLSDGLAARQLWDRFRSEARASYQMYRKEAGPEQTGDAKGLRRAWRIGRTMFWAMVMKLSPPRRVALILALLLWIAGVTRYEDEGRSMGLDLRGLGFLLLFVLLALELADRVTMKRDLEIARDIQRWLVPASPPQVSGLDIAFLTKPANTVAGDYYDAFTRDTGGRKLLLVVADVAGKSVPAALLMATFQASLHALAPECDDPVRLAERLNEFACKRSLEGRRFTTAFFAEVSLEERTLTYVNAGHNAPVLMRAGGATERLERGGLPLGIQAGARYEVGAASLGSGDLLLIFTDGLVEALDASGGEFGDGRVIDAVRELRGSTASAAIEGVLGRVERFSAGTPQYDDITCLAVKVV